MPMNAGKNPTKLYFPGWFRNRIKAKKTGLGSIRELP